MGSCKEEKPDEFEKPLKLVNTCMAILWLFLISLGGGLTMAWWELEYHSTNSQQWMVPFGLVLLVTPLIVCFSLVSDICNSSKDSSADVPVDDSVHHPV